jgi:hypothetical protein
MEVAVDTNFQAKSTLELITARKSYIVEAFELVFTFSHVILLGFLVSRSTLATRLLLTLIKDSSSDLPLSSSPKLGTCKLKRRKQSYVHVCHS